MGVKRDIGREPRSDAVRVVFCYGLDQQGGKGGANYLKDICPTILSDSHGTPHAVACIGIDLYNQAMTGGVSKTLNNRATDADHVPCVICYGISAYESNAMKSSNPHSGIYIAETSRTLDFNGGNPACNQGGCLCCASERKRRSADE